MLPIASCANRLVSINERIKMVEKRIKLLESGQTNFNKSSSSVYNQSGTDTSDSVARVKTDLFGRQIFSYRLVKVPSDYYDKTLNERASMLTCTTEQLCKSIVFENTACGHYDIEDKTYSRYYCVVVQYEARFDSDLLRDLIHSLRPIADRQPKKRFNFRMAKEEISEKLTGFSHNSVSPFGLLSKIPIVICQNIITSVEPKYIYLGGGDVDLKLGISIDDFIKGLNPIIGIISYPRDPSKLDNDFQD